MFNPKRKPKRGWGHLLTLPDPPFFAPLLNPRLRLGRASQVKGDLEGAMERYVTASVWPECGPPTIEATALFAELTWLGPPVVPF